MSKISNSITSLLWRLGFDVRSSKRQLSLESHLKFLFARLDIDLVFDVGAHHGNFARMLRNKLGYQGVIHSFEPQPQAFTILQNRAKPDSNWYVHNVALGETAGDATLIVSSEDVFSSLHSTSEFGQRNFAGKVDAQEHIQVPVRTLLDVIEREMPDFDLGNAFLKIDTQGHDKQVFAGAGEMRSAFCGLMSELAPQRIYDDAPDYLEMLSHYREFGYDLTGVFPICRDASRIKLVELDCVFARVENTDQREGGEGVLRNVPSQ